MRTVVLMWVTVVTWRLSESVDPHESFQMMRSGLDENLFNRANFEFVQGALENVFTNEITKLLESNQNTTSQCLNQLNEIIIATQNGGVWALKFLDSWGKFPSGIMWGHLVELGNFDECLSIEHNYTLDEDADLIKGQYCMADFPFGALFKNISEDVSQIPNIKIGICIPYSCEAIYINQVINQTLSQMLSTTITSDIVKQDKCIKSRKSEFEVIDWIAIIFFSIVGFLIFYSTIYDAVSERRGNIPKQILLAFSLSENMKLLFRTTSKKSPNIIGCLNGIRCISIIWIIFGHSYMISMFLPNINSVEILEWAQTPFSMFLQSGTISVDTFFFLSGLLLIWAGMKEMEKTGGKLNVPMMYLHRYIRLTPVVAAVMLFFVSLYRHMGDGPLWKSFISTYQLCHETWWATLIYIQNYAAAGKMCVGHTWYLAVDMQLYILSPLILIPIYKWKKKAVAAVIILGLLLVACVFTTIVINNYSVFNTTGNLGADTQEMRKIYYATHARASPWLIGIIFGYFLYNHRNSRVTVAREIVIGGWLISLTLLAVGIFSLYPKTLPGATPLTAVEGASYLTLTRVAWPLALSWIVFACVNGYGGFANAFLSWTFWQPMARLSYCMYITHLLIETINGGRTKVNTHFSDYDVMLRFWGDFGFTLIAAMITYLMFESPIIGIEKALFEKKENKSIKNATISNQNLCDNES